MPTTLSLSFSLSLRSSYSGMNFSKRPEKYVKYTPADLANAMASFFEEA